MHLYQSSTLIRMFAKRGKQPIVRTCVSSRQKIGFIGFVIPSTGELFIYECPVFNAQTFTQALHEFEKAYPTNKKRVIILDNASWHKKAVREARENQTFGDKHTYLFLPPYSPDLNPIERVWRNLRRNRTHNRYIPTLQSLRETVKTYLKSFAKPNNILSSLCA